MTSSMPISWVDVFLLTALIRFQLALVSVNLGVSLPWNVLREPQ